MVHLGLTIVTGLHWNIQNWGSYSEEK